MNEGIQQQTFTNFYKFLPFINNLKSQNQGHFFKRQKSKFESLYPMYFIFHYVDRTEFRQVKKNRILKLNG